MDIHVQIIKSLGGLKNNYGRRVLTDKHYVITVKDFRIVSLVLESYCSLIQDIKKISFYIQSYFLST